MLLLLRKLLRVSDKDLATGILMAAAKAVLADIQQRCAEALKALEQNDYLVGIGALAGLEEQLRFVNVRLMVLREIKEIQKQK